MSTESARIGQTDVPGTPSRDAFAEAAPFLLLPDWSAPANVRACVTTRRGGCSAAPFGAGDARGVGEGGEEGERSESGGLNLGFHTGDRPEAVAANRARLRAWVGGRAIAWLEQVHGSDVVDADVALAAPRPPRGDALVTERADLVCAIMVADCLPVLLADRAGRVVGAAHAGWRGLCAGVLERTAEAMARRAPGAPLRAYLGPAIGPQAFEVGAEVRAAFLDAAPPGERDASAAAFVALAPPQERAAHPGPSGREGAGHAPAFRADLTALARLRLQRAGLAPNAIHGAGECTWSRADRFFSYRRDTRTGRFAALIWRETPAGKP